MNSAPNKSAGLPRLNPTSPVAFQKDEEFSEILNSRPRLLERLKETEAEKARLREEVAALKRLRDDRDDMIRDLMRALSGIKLLHGLLPICSSCNKIRDDRGSWNLLETYICEHSEAAFTHGLCPECERQLYPQLFKSK